MSWWSALISPVTKVVTNWQDNKRFTEEQKFAIKAAEVESKIKLVEAEASAQIRRLNADADAQNNLDLLAVRQQESSWKDEFLLIVYMLPFIAAFFPQTQEYVEIGFQFLKEQAPDWYVYIVGGIFIHIFGFRRMLTQFLNKRGLNGLSIKGSDGKTGE